MNKKFMKELNETMRQNKSSEHTMVIGVGGKVFTLTRDTSHLAHYFTGDQLHGKLFATRMQELTIDLPIGNTSVIPSVENFTLPSKYPLCGFPPICSEKAMNHCLVTPLKDCDECNLPGAGIFALICIIIGLLILAGNGLMIWNVITKQTGFKDTYSKIRASLALADILSGVQIFAVILYNFVWTVQSPAYEIDLAEAELRGSSTAIFGGVLYLLGITSSLYHLVFLSSQRLYAIALPIQYKIRSKSSVFTGLITVWLLAAVSSTFPAWFPDKVTFTYYHTLFVYFPTHIEETITTFESGDVPALVALVLMLFLPYALMTGMSIVSGGLVHKYYKHRLRKLTASQLSKNLPKTTAKHEVHILKTVVIMQVGFTITLLPLGIATALFYAGILTCGNYSTPYFICFYLSISHSLVNVLVYITLSAKFRTSIRRSFFCCLPRCCRPTKKSLTVTIKNNNNNISTSQTKSSDTVKAIELKSHPSQQISSASEKEEFQEKYQEHQT